VSSPTLDLCLEYVAALSAAADVGSTLARDYLDVAVGEFCARLEGMVPDLAAREKTAAQAAPTPVRIIATAHLPQRIIKPGLHGQGNLFYVDP
jgi:hypothetical protein